MTYSAAHQQVSLWFGFTFGSSNVICLYFTVNVPNLIFQFSMKENFVSLCYVRLQEEEVNGF